MMVNWSELHWEMAGKSGLIQCLWRVKVNRSLRLSGGHKMMFIT